ncbi:MAG TPA: outer membrane beta-barrel protein [Gemmatimonas sp.]|nr:outer membrane beta-barrel protein [Gemmatimonas sp.]
MRLFKVIACAAAVAAPFAANAQATTDAPAIGFGIIGGATFPVGDYNKAAPAGFNIGGFVDFGRRLGPVGIRTDLLYHGFGDRNIVTTGGSATNVTISNKYSMVTGTLNGVIGVPLELSAIRPYVTGGVGAYYVRNSPRCSVNSITCSYNGSSESTTKFGLNGGAGIEFGLGGAAAFLESRFHQVFQGSPDLGCIGTANCNRAALQIVPVQLGVRIQF